MCYNLQAFALCLNADAFFASSFLCIFVLLRFVFCVFFLHFFCDFVFMPLCSLNYASSFSEICAFILGNMRLRFLARNENDVNLAVASTVYRFCKEGVANKQGKRFCSTCLRV